MAKILFVTEGSSGYRYTGIGDREKGYKLEGTAAGCREATGGEVGWTVNRAGSSERSWSRRRVEGKVQVYKVIRGTFYYQGDKQIWRLLRPTWRPVVNEGSSRKLGHNKSLPISKCLHLVHSQSETEGHGNQEEQKLSFKKFQ